MKITQAFTFEAAHRLPNVPTTHRCHRMHGHSYRVEITVSGQVDQVTGFVIDFFDLEAACNPVIAKLDHFCLNDIEGLRESDRRKYRDLALEKYRAERARAREHQGF